VLRDSARFSSQLPQFKFIEKIDPFGVPTILHSDPPAHTRTRKLVANYFKPACLDRIASLSRSICRTLLDKIEVEGEFDAVADLACPLPLAIVAEILGVPREDHATLKLLTERIFSLIRDALKAAVEILGGNSSLVEANGQAVNGVSAAITAVASSIPDSGGAAIASLREYFARETLRRKMSPGEDLISSMVTAHDEAGGLSTDEVIGIAELLLFAGHDTTVSLIANGLLALTQYPDQFARLRSFPELIPRAVEEILRFDSPVQMVLRFVTQQTEVGGTSLAAGAAALVMLGAANRDPAQFVHPEIFDIGRLPNDHLAFGNGVHSCLGAQLARIQARVAIGSVVERFPSLRLRHTETPLIYEGSILSRGLKTLPMTIR
jgi:cytochrome P450